MERGFLHCIYRDTQNNLCVCVIPKKKKRKKETGQSSKGEDPKSCQALKSPAVCVCVCVYVYEKDRRRPEPDIKSTMYHHPCVPVRHPCCNNPVARACCPNARWTAASCRTCLILWLGRDEGSSPSRREVSIVHRTRTFRCQFWAWSGKCSGTEGPVCWK